MTIPGCVLLERSDDWLIVVGDQTEYLAADVGADEMAVCVQLMSKLAGLKHLNCLLAPHATSCYFANLSPSTDIDLRDRAALSYELEDHLPIDAESMVADFAVLPSPDSDRRVSAIAIELDRWRSITTALESAGISVRSIVPGAVLATRALAHDLGGEESVELLVADDQDCDAITLTGRTIGAWKHFELDANSLRRHQVLDSASATQLVAGEDSEARTALIAAYPHATVVDKGFDELAIQGAELLLGQPPGRWFDLRRGALGPSDPLRAIGKPLRLVGLAAAACLLALAIGGWWRGNRIQREIASVRAEQQKLFRETFPDSRIPGALLRRVRSEHSKILASRGENTPTGLPTAAADVMRELIAALPSDVRFRFKRIQVLDGRVDLDIQVRNPVDAGTLAKSLSSAGFDVKPPGTTQKDAKTYESILEAEWIGVARPSKSDVSIRLSLQQGVAG